MAMKTFNILGLAARNLLRRRTRTLLAACAVALGTASVLLATSPGLTDVERFSGAVPGAGFIVEVGSAPGGPGLDDGAIAAFSGLEGVEAVIPQLSLPCRAGAGKFTAASLPVIALPADSLADLVRLDEGRGLSADATMPEMVLGRGAARLFSRDGSPGAREPAIDWLDTPVMLYLGDNDGTARRYKAAVVGLIDDGEEAGEYAYISLDSARRMIRENRALAKALGVPLNGYDRALIRAGGPDAVAGILEVVRARGFEASAAGEQTDPVQNWHRQLLAAGLISLAVAALGMANTLLAGVSARRREIGTLKVIGLTPAAVGGLFLLEALLTGLAGGVLGVLAAHGAAPLLPAPGLGPEAGARLPLSLWLDGCALAAAVLMAGLAGLPSAHRAARVPPMAMVE